MYKQRLYFFIFLCFIAVSVCFSRLAYMQVVGKTEAREKIRDDRLKDPMQLPTVRGSIYDRCMKELAIDKPQFYVKISYQLTKYRDPDFWEATIYNNMKDGKSFDDTREEMHVKYKKETDAIDDAIEKCSTLLNVDPEKLREQISKINRGIWKLREVVAWKRKFPESELYLEYQEKKKEVPYGMAMKDFNEHLVAMYPTSDPNVERCKLALSEDLKEMYDLHPIFEIADRQQLLEVQEEFTGMEGIKIVPMTERVYQYGSTACQLIGWVNPAQADENALFPKDVYSIYSAEDYSGESGIEEACEIILHGRRGEVRYSKDDDEPISRKPTIYGEDIHLSIDIELQYRIEQYLSDKTIFPEPDAEIGAVVIEVDTGEILAMASIPTYDLREIRKSKVYDAVMNSKAHPFWNKALYETYPPGSVIKPIFLTMGLETGEVTANTVFHCDGGDPKPGFPDCMIHRVSRYNHDDRWAGEGGNIGRNAIRGSCNIYFSILADKMPSKTIQNWLYNFGFGHKTLMPANYPGLLKELKRTESEAADRELTESEGIIWTGMPMPGKINSIHDLPPMKSFEKRRFGIGQASMQVTVLQVANSMATLARGGTFQYPRLFIGDTENKEYRPVPLGISSSTLHTVRDGMHAVVYESGGTAHDAYTNKKFKYDEKFPKRNITVFGKTGSTQKPYNAWFAAFAEDKSDRKLALAIVVKRGASGSKDAAPKGMRIIEICNEMGYIGD
ncbi:MAG: hypothetical protein K9M75_12725, partial [Phycisphaerae bacterium]|nr:hypothetical protein [Phycisphaerae bacterium]